MSLFIFVKYITLDIWFPFSIVRVPLSLIHEHIHYFVKGMFNKQILEINFLTMNMVIRNQPFRIVTMNTATILISAFLIGNESVVTHPDFIGFSEVLIIGEVYSFNITESLSSIKLSLSSIAELLH